MLENEPELFDDLRFRLYPIFPKKSPAESWVIFWEGIEAAALIAERLASVVDIRSDLEGDKHAEPFVKVIALHGGGTPLEVLHLRDELKSWHETSKLAKLGVWSLELVVMLLAKWGSAKLEPERVRLYTPDEVAGDKFGFPVRASVNPGVLPAQPFTFRLLPVAHGEGTYLQRLVELNDNGDEVWLYDAENAEYLSWSYQLTFRTRAHEKRRLLAAFEASLEHHLDACEQAAQAVGFQPTKIKRARSGAGVHFTWLYQRHIRGLTYREIADSAVGAVSESAVQRAVTETAALVGIDLP